MGRYLKLGASSLQRNLLEGHCDHLGDRRDQSGVHLRSCNFLCAFVLAEEKRRKAVPDDVRTADGNSFFSCSSNLPVYLPAEERCDQQPVGRREYRLDDRDALRHVGCLHYDDLDECGYQLHFFAGWFPGCAAGSDRKCLSGRCRCLGKNLACYVANGIPADLLRSVLEYRNLFPQLRAD